MPSGSLVLRGPLSNAASERHRVGVTPVFGGGIASARGAPSGSSPRRRRAASRSRAARVFAGVTEMGTEHVAISALVPHRRDVAAVDATSGLERRDREQESWMPVHPSPPDDARADTPLWRGSRLPGPERQRADQAEHVESAARRREGGRGGQRPLRTGQPGTAPQRRVRPRVIRRAWVNGHPALLLAVSPFESGGGVHGGHIAAVWEPGRRWLRARVPISVTPARARRVSAKSSAAGRGDEPLARRRADATPPREDGGYPPPDDARWPHWKAGPRRTRLPEGSGRDQSGSSDMRDTFAARAGRWSTQHRGMAIGLWLAFVLPRSSRQPPRASSRATTTAVPARPRAPSARSITTSPRAPTRASSSRRREARPWADARVRAAVDVVGASVGERKPHVADVVSPYAAGRRGSKSRPTATPALVKFDLQGDAETRRPRSAPWWTP